MTFANGYDGNSRIKGRWEAEGYNPIPTSPTNGYGYQSLGTVYDPSHPIMDGISDMTAYYQHVTYGVTPGATRLADFSNGYTLIAYTNEGHWGPGSGRVVGQNFFPYPGYITGDAMPLVANCLFWASQQSPPTILPMPIQLEPVSHIYEDDHPDTTTPLDTFDVKLEVKDDDHGRIFGGAGADWSKNLAWNGVPLCTPSHSGGGVGVWGPERLNNGDKIGTYNDCWTAGNGGVGNWNMYEWTTPQFIGGMTAYYTRYRTISGYTLHACYVEWWDGSSWVTDQYYDDNDHYNDHIDAVIELTAPVTTTRVRTRDMKTFGANSNIMIQEWEIHPGQTGGDPYEMNGLGEDFCDVTIENVFPQATGSPDFVNVVGERVSIGFEGFSITDPALMVETEEFWYRWDYGDGTAMGPWLYKGQVTAMDTVLDVLLLHSYTPGEDLGIISGLQAIMGPEPRFESYDCGPNGHNDAPDLEYLMGFDVIVIGSNYIPSPAVGDVLDDFVAEGRGVVELVAMMHPSYGIGGEWRTKGYSVFPQSSSTTTYSSVTILDPSHPIIDGEYGVVSSWGCTLAIGLSSVEPGATLLAYASATRAAAYRDFDNVHPGSGRVVGIDTFPQSGYHSGDTFLVIANAIHWAMRTPNTPVLDTTYHDYGDNGMYDCVLHVIDDDMNWAFGGPQPVFVGTGNPDDWVSMTHFPVEVTNVDPVISPRMRAQVDLDLVIRTTGEPKNDCTMTLWQGTTSLGSVTVYHDGNYKMETLPATLDMGAINDYYVTVEYENADPDGANPTWIFEGRFPSGHTKELKNVFKEDGTIWTVDSSLLKTMLIGEDIIFTAVGADEGSDDLAFDWQFGDGGNDIHVVANADSSMVEGASDEPENIFDVLPNRDPWFDRAPNTIRSPDMNPITFVDEVSHAYMEGGYYYVTLILMDDDVCDGYPSFQVFLNGGGYDMEFMEIDLS
jgi:hypothetical protein